ncbi:putative dehydrogenase [Cystobacter fuscus DSM 2262]|uniref:Dehydrogenase n=1 Tax=Cystobacter fuscus (strain ATCC 25194 / DSM 2262 / NBRC 100088 / M29) TaxID=1242864 RepID=S9Q1H9_CYSF2|nr:Gfo/Idh/MocA family oxidoreductase [Cystobacter fuscus]EPX55114.1 putative dehydrogenase [Cystobacter fuscus DSM 2262]
MSFDETRRWTRRRLLETTGGLLGASLWLPETALAAAGEVKLPPMKATTEVESPLPTPQAPDKRVGFAIVGLGRLSLEELLPAFGECKKARLVALVSGDKDKARTVAAQYGVSEKNLYDYKNYDALKDNPEVHAVYIVLPNNMHAEYTVRAAKAGKHVLCEKPMANSVAECQQMIDACRAAKKQLMVAYRLQYEPHHRTAIQLARSKKLGALKLFSADNGQNQAPDAQWRHKKAQAGGGALPDVGIYCLSAARYLSGEEPVEVWGSMYSTPGDARFKEVEENFLFTLRFPSGLLAQCTTGYGHHDSRRMRLMGSEAWVDMDNAFAYSGLRMRISRKSPEDPKASDTVERSLPQPSQFAREMDHFAECVQNNRQPHTPGEEGLQDMRIIEALYRAAREGKSQKLEAVGKQDAFRGPAPSAEG